TDEDWAEVSVGTSTYFAIKKDGSLWRWGAWFSITDGGITGLVTPEPVQVGADSDWASVSVGAVSCAIKTDGALLCLGHNNSGRVGDGTTQDRLEPTPVSGGGKWVTVAPSSRTCGLKTDGTIWCWGNDMGPIPVQMGTDSDWVEIAGRDRSVTGRRK